MGRLPTAATLPEEYIWDAANPNLGREYIALSAFSVTIYMCRILQKTINLSSENAAYL